MYTTVTSCSSKNTLLEQKFRSELSPCPDPPNRISFWPGPCSETQRQSYKICKETLSFIYCRNIPTEIINHQVYTDYELVCSGTIGNLTIWRLRQFMIFIFYFPYPSFTFLKPLRDTGLTLKPPVLVYQSDTGDTAFAYNCIHKCYACGMVQRTGLREPLLTLRNHHSKLFTL